MLVFTATTLPSLVRTVDVTVRMGFVHSLIAYTSPRGQMLPEISIFSPMSTVS